MIFNATTHLLIYVTVRKVDLLCTHKRLAVVVHKVCGVIATTNTVPGCQPITRVLIYKTWECQIKTHLMKLELQMYD